MATLPNAFERQVSREKNVNSQRMIWTAAAMGFFKLQLLCLVRLFLALPARTLSRAIREVLYPG